FATTLARACPLPACAVGAPRIAKFFQRSIRRDCAMSMKLDARLASTGTRFRLFAQPRFIDGFETPETIFVSVPPTLMQAGPPRGQEICDRCHKKISIG